MRSLRDALGCSWDQIESPDGPRGGQDGRKMASRGLTESQDGSKRAQMIYKTALLTDARSF